MRSLPRSLNELNGLRAARWIRESTARQADNFGPDAQRDQQDRAIERYGLVDTGIAWQVAHSGRTIAKTPQWADMLARAGREYDVLVVGYVSRFARSEDHVFAKRELHAAGAAVLYADERILTSDDEAWEGWWREVGEAVTYSRRLGRRIREGYEAKFRREADQAGAAPLGFHRTGDRHTLAIDPATIGTAVALFERYAADVVSFDELATETGIATDAIRELLRNPIYNGWVRRHRRGPDEERRRAAWREDPPVPDALWARVQEVRQDRWTGGGGPQVRVYPLGKRLWCVCGRRLRSDTGNPGGGYIYRRYAHPDPCPDWRQRSYLAPVFEEPIDSLVTGMRADAKLLTSLRALAGIRAPVATAIRRRQLQRELADRAALHARRALTTEAYLAEHERITATMDGLASAGDAPVVDPDVAIRRLRDIRSAWRDSLDDPKGESVRAGLVAALFQRITVRDDRIVEVEPTPDAARHGASLALPELVSLARRAGFERGEGTYRIVVVGRREWRELVRSA